MLLGEFQHNLDTKGRITIPAKFRGDLAAGLVVTRGFDQNLIAFPLNEWEILAQDIMKQPLSQRHARDFRRRVFSSATDLTPDRQGRILLPTSLRDFAGLENEVVIAGMYNHIEIWSHSRWTDVRETIENNDEDRWEGLGI